MTYSQRENIDGGDDILQDGKLVPIAVVVARLNTLDRYRKALIKIRDMDYRGNRSVESGIAYRQLWQFEDK